MLFDIQRLGLVTDEGRKPTNIERQLRRKSHYFPEWQTGAWRMIGRGLHAKRFRFWLCVERKKNIQ